MTDEKPKGLYGWKEFIQDAVGEHEATTSPVYTEEDEVEHMMFAILDEDGPYVVVIRRPTAEEEASS